MTKERKIAIQMWLWIRASFEEYEDYFWGASDEDGFLIEMKHRYLTYVLSPNDFHPNWLHDCWLCHYALRSPKYTQQLNGYTPDRCAHCPLKSCMQGSPYACLEDHKDENGEIEITEEQYRNWCTQVLRALGYKGE